MASKNAQKDIVSEPGAGASVPVQLSPPAPVPVQAVAPAPVLLSFGVYFQSLGKPSHHAAGMAKFADVRYPRTKEAWDRAFAAY